MEVIMKIKEKDPYGIQRLDSKTVRNAIIQKISEDFDLPPVIAEAYFQQISGYFQEHFNVALQRGQIAYEAIAGEDRYIRDFEAVRTVVNHGITDIDEIVQITKLSKRVVQQYLDLLPNEKS